MGNTADKSDSGYSCDTLAREITFKQYRSGSEHTSGGSSDESNSNSFNNRDSKMRPLTHQSSVRRRKDLRASFRKSRHGGGEKKGATPFKLSDMEVECVDGKVCRLVPRDSAKQRKKVSRSSSKKSVKRSVVKSRPVIKPDLFEQQPQSKPSLPPKTKEKQIRLTSEDIWQLDSKPDLLKCEQQWKPALPPKRKNNNVTSQPITDHRFKQTEVNLNNNKIESRQTKLVAGDGHWFTDKRLHTTTELYVAQKPRKLATPDVARCADLNQRLNKMKLVSPISDV